MNKLTSIKVACIGFFLCLFTLANFAQAPVINSFSPLSSSIGSTVTITGSGFDTTPSNNIVVFGVVKGNVTAATATSLEVTVPAGASYAPISVNTNGLTCYSPIPFMNLFDGGGTLAANSFQYGSFPYPTGQYVRPVSIAIADMDGDGKSDFGSFNAGEQFSMGDTIAIFRNTSSNGSLSFAPKFRIVISGFFHDPVNIYFQDIDGDSKPDIVALNLSGHFSIYRNTSTSGNLSFDLPVLVDLAGQHGNRAVFGDFDNDGKTDIAIAVTGSFLNIYRNGSSPGNIIIDPSPVSAIPFVDPLDLKTADIDVDGKTDIIMSVSDNITILRNTTSGSSIAFVPFNLATPGVIGNFVIGDLDDDQKQEIIVNTGNVSIFRNTSTPGLLSFAARDDKAINSSGININDMDGDGKPDLLAGTSVDSISIYKNISLGATISFANKISIASAMQPVFASLPAFICDLDIDGKPDILAFIAVDFETGITYIENKMGEPKLNSFTPRKAFGDTTVTISGYNFNAVTAVRIGSTPAISFEILSPTTISAIIAGGSAGRIIVTNPYGIDSLGFFNTPFINSFSPYLAGPGSADSVVTINGYNFTGVTSVNFGDFPASSFTVISDTQIKAVTGEGYISPNFPYVPVTVTSAYGTASRDNFVYLAAVISELCPPASSVTLTSNVIIPGATYHWQLAIGNGNYNEITDGGYYSGSQTTSLHLSNIPSSQYGYRYRCATGNLGLSNQISTVQLIKFVDQWTGSVSTAWEDPANWSCGRVPDSGTDVVINTGAAIVLNSDTTIRSLIISPGASLTIGSGFNLTILH